MYFSSLTVKNFKSFTTETTFHLKEGLNYIVGNNNCGKSTVFEALLYLTSRTGDLEKYQNVNHPDEPFWVKAELRGPEIAELVEQNDNYKKLKPYIIKDQAGPHFKVMRSEAKRTVTQNNKKVSLDGKKITFLNPTTNEYENPTGIDALFKGLCDITPIFADTTTGDIADFGTTKTLGKLIAAAANSFRSTNTWSHFVESHRQAFSSDNSESLASLTSGISQRIEVLVSKQYGPAKVRLDFALPDPTAFIKAGQLLVEDHEYETDLFSKGTGMQRAVILALIQVLAEQNNSESVAPLTLLLDEPETWLHPQAQLTLSTALGEIAATQQVFLITHSPFMLRSFRHNQDNLMVFRSTPNGTTISNSREMGKIQKGSPSWGEIIYFAFQIASPELHNELWGKIEIELETSGKIKKVNRILHENYALPKNKKYTRAHPNRGSDNDADTPRTTTEEATLPYYIRNAIHHPDNSYLPSPPFSDEELTESIHQMLRVLDQINESSTTTIP